MSARRLVFVAMCILALAIAQGATAQVLPTFPDVTTFEKRKSTYLPDPFVMQNGQRVSTCDDWQKHREYLRQMVLYYVYGRMPPPPGNVTAQVTSTTSIANGEQKRITLKFGPSTSPLTMTGIYSFPAGKAGPLPVVVTSGYKGAAPDAGGLASAMRRGYIMADIHPAEMAPDDPDPNRNSPAYKAYPDYDWGSIGVWAWGFHRATDYLFTLPEVDKSKLIYSACSRWGKTVVAAGMTDDRVAIVNPHQSGSGGCAAGMVTRPGIRSETIGLLTNSFGYQFTPRFAKCAGNEDRMPFDQHFALAVMAPRHLLDTEGHTGDCDGWLNAYGSEQSVWAAKRVWDFLGAGDRIVAHIYNEAHTQSTADWNALFDYADLVFKGTPLPTGYFDNRYPADPKLVPWTAPTPVNCSVDGGATVDGGLATGDGGANADSGTAASLDAPGGSSGGAGGNNRNTGGSTGNPNLGGAAGKTTDATGGTKGPTSTGPGTSSGGTNGGSRTAGSPSDGCSCEIGARSARGGHAFLLGLAPFICFGCRWLGYRRKPNVRQAVEIDGGGAFRPT